MQTIISENEFEKGLLKAKEDRNQKFNRNKGVIEKHYETLDPKHRESFDYFRSLGIFLPMSSAND